MRKNEVFNSFGEKWKQKVRFYKNGLFCGGFLRFFVVFKTFVAASGCKTNYKKTPQSGVFVFISAGAEPLPGQLSAAG